MSKKRKFKFSRGSVLVFSLMVMFILLVISIGIMSASVIERKSSGASGKAATAFQVADSGVEDFLQKIKGQTGLTIGTILGASCNAGIFSGTMGANSYNVTFYQIDNTPLTCADDVSLVDHIKSVGTGSGATRAIEVAVAAIGSGCYVSYKSGCAGDACCLAGFTSAGSVNWFSCSAAAAVTETYILPLGATGCAVGYVQSAGAVANVCCK